MKFEDHSISMASQRNGKKHFATLTIWLGWPCWNLSFQQHVEVESQRNCLTFQHVPATCTIRPPPRGPCSFCFCWLRTTRPGHEDMVHDMALGYPWAKFGVHHGYDHLVTWSLYFTTSMNWPMLCELWWLTTGLMVELADFWSIEPDSWNDPCTLLPSRSSSLRSTKRQKHF